MSSEPEAHETPKKKKKKGVINPETYQRNIIRESRIHGKEYINYKGKRISQKTVPQEIKCSCHAKCFNRITKEDLNDIWTKFYSMENKNIQDVYLQTLIERKGIKRRKRRLQSLAPSENQSVENEDKEDNQELSFKRKHSFVYRLRVKGEFFNVCRNVFIMAHGVTVDRIRRICTLLLQNETPVDKRGKSKSGNAMPGRIRAKPKHQSFRRKKKPSMEQYVSNI